MKRKQQKRQYEVIEQYLAFEAFWKKRMEAYAGEL